MKRIPSGTQKDEIHIRQNDGVMDMVTLIDHRLPLIRLKEMRRELVLALGEDKNAITAAKLHEIASIQQAIAAAEEVIADVDAELERDATDYRVNLRHYA